MNLRDPSVSKGKKTYIKNVFYNLILTIGIVIGIGIFFKNQKVIAGAHGDTLVVILAWVIGGIIAMSLAIAFSILNNRAENSDNNIGEFVRLTYGEKSGKWLSYSFLFIFYPILVYIICTFTSVFLFQLIDLNITNSYLYTVYLNISSITMIVILVACSFFAQKFQKGYQIASTIIKIFPFIIMVIIAIIGIFSRNADAFWNGGGQASLEGKEVEYNVKKIVQQTNGMSRGGRIFWLIPPILLAFEGFISITGNKRASSAKAVSLGIGIGMSIVTVIYILTTVAILSQGTINVSDAITNFFGGNTSSNSKIAQIMNKVILTFIVISGTGAANAGAIIWQRTAKQIADDNKVQKKRNILLFNIFGFLFSTVPWMILTLSMGLGAGVIDRVSDILLLIAPAIYASILIKAIIDLTKINKEKKQLTKEEKSSSYIFYVFSSIAILGISILVGYGVADGIIIQSIINGKNKGEMGFPKWSYLVFLIAFGLQFALAPLVGMESTKWFLKMENRSVSVNK